MAKKKKKPSKQEKRIVKNRFSDILGHSKVKKESTRIS